MRDAVPFAWEAFEDYQLYSQRWSRLEAEIFKKIMSPVTEHKLTEMMDAIGMENKRERAEFVEKMRKLNLIR